MRSPLLLAVLLLATACDEQDAATPSSGEREVEQLKLPTDAERAAESKIEEAQIFLDAGKPKLAEPLLRGALELSPKSPRASRMLGTALVARGALDDAIPLLARALQAEPKDGPSQDLYVRTLKAKGDLAAAETACRAWVQALPDSDDAAFQHGTILLELNRPKDAILALRRAESLKAGRADIRTQLALALLADNQLDKAEAKLRDALQRDPHSSDAWFHLGDVITRRDETRNAEAAEAMTKAVQENERNIVAHLYLYRLAKLVAKDAADPLTARAEKSWAAVLRLHGRAQIQIQGLGREAGDKDEQSEYVLREAVTLAPDDPAPRAALARFLHRERRLDEAAEAYRRAIDLGARDWKTRTRLAAALMSDPGDRAARGDAGDAPTDAKKVERAARLVSAESELRTALDTNPAETVPRRLLAWCLLLEDRATNAMGAADETLRLAPTDALVRKSRALARMRSGEVDQGMHDLAAAGWLE